MQTNSRRHYFYFLPDQAQTHLDHWKVLDEPGGNFIQIRQRVKNFPIDPHCKKCPLLATLYLSEIRHQSLSKYSNDRGEFELDRARSKNNIAENPFALEIGRAHV